MELSAREIFEVLLPRLEKVGVDLEQLLAAADFPVRSREEMPHGYLDTTDLANEACRLSDDPLVLIRAIEGPPVGADLFGLFLAAQPTLLDGLKTLRDFVPVVCSGARIELSEAGESFLIQLSPLAQTWDPLSVEWIVCGIIASLRQMTEGRAKIRRVFFQHAARVPHEHYRAVVDLPLSFQQTINGIELDRLSVEDRLPGWNERNRKDIGWRLQREMELLRHTDDLRSIAKQTILMDLKAGEEASLRSVAGTLGLSERTLQRRLQSQGLKFKDIKSESRVEWAKELLKDDGIPLTRLASKVGFAYPSNFTRAFKRSTGMTPVEYRKGLNR